MESRRNERLRAVHNDAGMVTPDEMPLVWLARLLGKSRALDSTLITTTRSHMVATFTLLRFEKANSLGAPAVQNNNHCLQQDVNVEPDGPVSNIEEILRLLNLQIAVAPR